MPRHPPPQRGPLLGAKPPALAQVRVRTRINQKTEDEKEEKVKKSSKKKRKKKGKKRGTVLVNALFAGAASARRIAFAIDISGSMSAAEPSFGGMSRIDVVKNHMRSALRCLEGVRKGAFGIALFDSMCHLPCGPGLIPATSSGVSIGIAAIDAMVANGGNGGESACLNACLAMAPDAVFFLGDGGWDSGGLISAASSARTAIHSIAFFTTGGGLQEIAALTAGTYREIHGSGDLQEVTPSQSAAAAEMEGDQSCCSDSDCSSESASGVSGQGESSDSSDSD